MDGSWMGMTNRDEQEVRREKEDEEEEELKEEEAPFLRQKLASESIMT